MQVGTDIVYLPRLKNISSSFITGVLSKDEQKLYDIRVDKLEFLGGHYAAKEAFLKALGVGLAGAKLIEIEVKYDEKGKPFIVYQKKSYELSISHDGDYAIAVVIIS